MSQLRLTVLGEATIVLDGKPLQGLTSRKAQALLYYLAVSGCAHSRSSLAGLLWSDIPEASARTNLRKELSRLRQVVRPFLKIDRATVRFNQTANYWLDVESFVTLAQPQSEIAELARAVALYQSDFLNHFDVRNAGLFDEWVLVTRARLRELALQTLFKLGAGHQTYGQFGEAIRYTRRLLELEPWREDAHRQLMRLLAFSGRRSEALIQYENCQRILAEELGGVEPSAETTKLYKQILAGTLKPPEIKPQANSPAKSLKKVASNLPGSATSFIGREAELAELIAWITRLERRLVTVVGLGGMGKTRLALKLGEMIIQGNDELFYDGIFFVPLASVNEVTHIVPAMAASLKITLDKIGDPKEQLLGYLRRKKLLLIIDNCEHLLDGAALMVEILSSASGVSIVATSRERLLLQGEHVFLLEGLAYPHEQTQARFQEVEAYTAVQLFQQAAQRVLPSFDIIAADSAHLKHICHLVAGMPLGLELAAGWLDIMPLAKIAQEIQRNFGFLESEMRDLPDRHRSIRAVFNASWQQMTPEEQTIFVQLSVFRGGFTRAAAYEVTSATLRQLSRLHVKSLLQFSHEDDRCQMHTLLRQFALEKLAKDETLATAVRDRHATYYCRFLQKQEKGLKGAGFLTALTEIDTEIGNIRAAWAWAVTQHHTDLLQQAAEALGWFYFWLTRHQESFKAFQQAAEGIETLITHSPHPDSGALRLWAVLLGWQGWIANEISATGFELCQKALNILERYEFDNQDVRSEKALILGLIGPGIGIMSTAEQSLALYRELEDKWGIAFQLGRRAAEVMYHQDDYQTAEAFFLDLWPLTRQLGHPWQMSWVCMTFGRVYFLQGRFLKAEAWLQRARTLILESNYGAGISREQLYTVELRLYQGRFTEASSQVEEAIIFRQQNEVGAMFEAWLEGNQSIAFLHLGQYKLAQLSAQKTLEFFESKESSFSVRGQLSLANVLLALGEYEEALSLASQAAKTSHRNSERFFADTTRSYLLYQMGEQAQAKQLLQGVLDFAVTNRSFFHVIAAVPQAALWLAEEGDFERAVEVYALATTFDHVGKSQWFADLMGDPISKRAATLPDDVVAAAKARGNKLDIWQTAAALLEEATEMSKVCWPPSSSV